MTRFVHPRRLLIFFALVPLAFGVEGRVFIATRTGQVAILPSVAIRAYAAAQFADLVAHSAAARKKYEKLGRRLTTLLDEFNDTTQANIPAGERTRLLERNSAESKSILGQLEDFAPAFLSSLKLPPLAETTSDAEGNYRLALKDPAGVVIVAVAERQVAASTEHYYWIVFDPPAQLNLSSETLTRVPPWDASLRAPRK